VNKWNLNVLAIHRQWLYDKLIDERHITSKSPLKIDFEEGVFLTGFFAIKDRTKYFIDKHIINMLPIQAGKGIEMLHYKEHEIEHPLTPIPFKIKPDQTYMNFREFVDGFCDFEHSNPKHWTLLKLIGLIGYIGRIYTSVASDSEFGKSGIFKVINSVTDRCPVFRPRSVPGVLNKINTTGNMVFDDVLDSKKEVKEIMEEFSLNLADGSPSYINGAMKSSRTKNTYQVHNQSITYLYNNIDYYKDQTKYFENMFLNNGAIDTRFLKLKLTGVLQEKFTKDFDMIQCANDNRQTYIDTAKYLLWMQNLKVTNSYSLQYDHTKSLLKLKGRRKSIYNDILWVLDMYCTSQLEFDDMLLQLDNAVLDYKQMINHTEIQQIKEEYVV